MKAGRLRSRPGAGSPAPRRCWRSLLDEAAGRGLQLARLADAISGCPARRLRLAGKGRLEPGSDADLVLVDPTRAWTLAARTCATATALSPFVGRALRGRVVRTLVRGRTVALDGQVVGEPTGRLVRPRALTADRPRTSRRETTMSNVRITAGPFSFTRRFEEERAPKTVAAFRGAAAVTQPDHPRALERRVGWIPLGDLDLGPRVREPHELPAPGEVLLYPGGFSETEILFPYGGDALREHRRPAGRQPLPHDRGGTRAPA